MYLNTVSSYALSELRAEIEQDILDEIFSAACDTGNRDVWLLVSGETDQGKALLKTLADDRMQARIEAAQTDFDELDDYCLGDMKAQDPEAFIEWVADLNGCATEEAIQIIQRVE